MQNFSVKTTQDQPAPFQQISIPLSNGMELAARLWLPATSGAAKVPVVLEWIPYRQSDGTALADSMMHGYFAENGIAACRVDIRGSGNSPGLLRDEYLQQEQDDALEVIAWLAAQPWCNGNLGMVGISWGGFAGLQIAARRPPALKAIITACSTDDRYRDDVHFMGGALLIDGIQWGAGLFTQLARPPDPAHVGEKWHDMWTARLEGLEPPLANWMSHMDRDAYWRHGSVCENYANIQCAVWAVGGWVDGYTDPILRLMEHLPGPRKALIGPWTHMYPTWGQPGPQIGFLQECVRWWRHWLMDEDTGIMKEPLLRLWVGNNPRPDSSTPQIDGDWIGLDSWPPAAPVTTFFADDRKLSHERGDDAQVVLDSPLTLGMTGGEWCPLDGGGNGPEFATDAALDDGMSLCFDTAILVKPLHLIGVAKLNLSVALEGERALLAIRLNEVKPDGIVARVTFGVHRVKRPEGIAPGQYFDVSLPIKSVAHAFAPGSRLRLAMSTSYWPMVWPEARDNAVQLATGKLKLDLPGLPTDVQRDLPAFDDAVHAMPVVSTTISAGHVSRVVHWDQTTGSSALVSVNEPSSRQIDGLQITSSGAHDYFIEPHDGTSARAGFQFSETYERGGWSVRIETDTQVYRNNDQLVLKSRCTAISGIKEVFDRTWIHVFDY